MSELSPSFPSLYPPGNRVIVPEYARRTTLEGLPVGHVTFPYNSAFLVDSESDTILLRGSYGYDDDDTEPEYLNGRVGLLRVFENSGGRLKDCFVADFRFAHPGSMERRAVSSQHEEYADERLTTILAAVFKDPDGNPHFLGEDALQGHVRYLATKTDELAVELLGTTSEIPVRPIHPGPSHVPGEFLG